MSKRREKEKLREEVLEEEEGNAYMKDNLGPASSTEFNKLLKGKGTVSMKSLRAMLQGLLTRKNIQYIGIVYTGFFALLIGLGGLVSLSILFANSASNFNMLPFVAVNALPQIFVMGCIVGAGVAFGSKETDVKTGGGLTALVFAIFFVICGSIVFAENTPVVWQSCPSMSGVGTGLVTFAKAYAYGNFTFDPVDPLNPTDNALYYTKAQFEKTIYYITAEVMCHSSSWFQFFWWLNMASYFIVCIAILLLCGDLYYNYKSLNNLEKYIGDKFSISNGKNGKASIKIGKKDNEEGDE